MNETYKPNQTNQKPNHTRRNIARLGAGALATVYLVGFLNNQNELSKAVNPLYEEMITLIEEKKDGYPEKSRHEAKFDFNYGGKMTKINNTIEEFMEDNDISKKLMRPWGPIVRPGDAFQFPRAPVPRAYNPLKWDNKIDTSAVQKYFMDTYGKNYKKRIAHVHEAMEKMYGKK